MATTSELHIAYRQARSRFGDNAWFAMEMPQRIEQIEAESWSLLCEPGGEAPGAAVLSGARVPPKAVPAVLCVANPGNYTNGSKV
jgi:hypothetical protein